jgi:hypothetical protein
VICVPVRRGHCDCAAAPSGAAVVHTINKVAVAHSWGHGVGFSNRVGYLQGRGSLRADN